MSLKKSFTHLLIITITLITIGCSSEGGQIIDEGGLPAEIGQVNGNIVIHDMTDNVKLPEDVIVTVRLEDVSIADAPSTVLSERIYEGVLQLPLTYTLQYELDSIKETNTYIVSAEIKNIKGDLLYTNDTMHLVLTNDNGNSVNVELIAIEGAVIDENESTTLSELDGTGWKLRAFSLDDEWREALETVEITLNFTNNQIDGTAGCNTYFGSYKVDGTTLTIDEVGLTFMACEEEVMQQEDIFFEALAQAQSYEWAENSLMIDYGDNVSLVFDRYQTID